MGRRSLARLAGACLVVVLAVALAPAPAAAPPAPPPAHPAEAAALAFVAATADPARHRPDAVAAGPYAAYLEDIAWPALRQAGARRVAWAEARRTAAPQGRPPAVRVTVRYALDAPARGGGAVRAVVTDTLALALTPQGWKVAGARRGEDPLKADSEEESRP